MANTDCDGSYLAAMPVSRCAREAEQPLQSFTRITIHLRGGRDLRKRVVEAVRDPFVSAYRQLRLAHTDCRAALERAPNKFGGHSGLAQDLLVHDAVVAKRVELVNAYERWRKACMGRREQGVHSRVFRGRIVQFCNSTTMSKRLLLRESPGADGGRYRSAHGRETGRSCSPRRRACKACTSRGLWRADAR